MFQNRTDITLNFLTSDWFVHYTANTKGKECGWIFSSLASHADFPRASRTLRRSAQQADLTDKYNQGLGLNVASFYLYLTLST